MLKSFLFSAVIFTVFSSFGMDLRVIDSRCSPKTCAIAAQVVVDGDAARYLVFSYDSGSDAGGPEYRVAKVNLDTEQMEWISVPFESLSWDSGSSISVSKIMVTATTLQIPVRHSYEAAEDFNYILLVDKMTGQILHK